jgi:DNA repair protein RadC
MTKCSLDLDKRATPADHAKGYHVPMRGKLLKKGWAAPNELEILEMLLYSGAPRGDTKPLAKRLIRIFKSLSAVLRASADDLRPIKDMDDSVIAAVKIAKTAGLQISHSRADIEVTNGIKKAFAVMGIALHDHLIVVGTSCVSFKSLGHL